MWYYVEFDDNSILDESILTTTTTTYDMASSYNVSRDESESLLEGYSSNDDLRDSKFHIVSIVLNEESDHSLEDNEPSHLLTEI